MLNVEMMLFYKVQSCTGKGSQILILRKIGENVFLKCKLLSAYIFMEKMEYAPLGCLPGFWILIICYNVKPNTMLGLISLVNKSRI